MRVAAIQLQTVIGDIDANLAACERLADAAAAGARVTRGVVRRGKILAPSGGSGIECALLTD